MWVEIHYYKIKDIVGKASFCSVLKIDGWNQVLVEINGNCSKLYGDILRVGKCVFSDDLIKM